jgi:putative SOS response-associated peptidase YedK
VCNEYRFNAARDAIAAEFAKLQIPIRFAGAASNQPLGEPIKPTDRATVIRPDNPFNPGAGVHLSDIRWWLVPHFHRKAVKDWRAMCTNARFETVDTNPTFRDAYKKRRCLVPLTCFIEYSEPAGWKKGQPKTRHEIAWQDGGIRYFAGLWDRSNPADMPEGLETFAFITGPCCPDVEPIHDRTPAILTLEQGMEWLNLEGPGKDAFAEQPPLGTYEVSEAPRERIISPEMRRALP